MLEFSGKGGVLGIDEEPWLEDGKVRKALFNGELHCSVNDDCKFVDCIFTEGAVIEVEDTATTVIFDNCDIGPDARIIWNPAETTVEFLHMDDVIEEEPNEESFFDKMEEEDEIPTIIHAAPVVVQHEK